MEKPPGLQKPKRVAAMLPVLALLVVVVVVTIFAISHLAVKGGAPQAGSTAEEVATSRTPPTRDAYNMEDFTEPKSK